MTRCILMAGVLMVATLAAQPMRAQGPTRTPINGKGHGSLDAIDQLVLAYLKDNKIPGVTVAVTVKGRKVYDKAFGYADANAKTAMQPTHRTLIGSVSKVLTTAAVMKLHETSGNGFSVDQKMYGGTGVFKSPEYLHAIKVGTHTVGQPGVSLMEQWYYNTQVKHLLSHSAGWNGSGDAEGAAKMFGVPEGQTTPRHHHLHFLMARPLIAPPGTKYNYSNRSVGVMDHVIETVSGEDYVTYVKKKVLQPIGLNHVAAVSDRATSLDASPHKYINGGTAFTRFTLETKEATGSAGGWRATAGDLVRFMVATDQLGNQSDILQPQTLNLMETPPFPSTVPNRALGWGVNVKGPGKSLTHSGLLDGGAAYIAKFTPGYIAGDGTDLTHVTVAICANIRQNDGNKSLAVDIARLTGKTSIPITYNLFRRANFALND